MLHRSAAAIRVDDSEGVLSLEAGSKSNSRSTMLHQLQHVASAERMALRARSRMSHVVDFEGDRAALGHLGTSPSEGTVVPAGAIDTLTDWLQRSASLIQLNLQGSELSALRGARQMLEACLPVRLIDLEEVQFRHQGRSVPDVLSLFRSVGYMRRTSFPDSPNVDLE